MSNPSAAYAAHGKEFHRDTNDVQACTTRDARDGWPVDA